MKKRIFVFLTVLAALLSLGLPVLATETDGFVRDHAGLLTDAEETQLEAAAQSLMDSYSFGMYVVTEQDFTASGYFDVYDYAYDLYDQYALAENGLLLVLSMDQREYALILNGYNAHEIFDDSALDRLESGFLEEFADDRWMAGFEVYYKTGGEVLSAPGQPSSSVSPSYDYSYVEPSYDYEYVQGYRRTGFSVTALVIGFIAAGAVCLALSMQMKTARKQSSAGAYILDRGITFTHREDRFTHRTHHRRRVSSSHNSHGPRHRSGGGSRPSGGGSRRSGRSGRF